MHLSSPTFLHQHAIPERCTCEGADVSPALAWTDPPANTQSFVLIVDDPDAPDPAAPRTTWVHWVLFNLPASCRGLPEGAQDLPAGTGQGRNDWKRAGYGGPCPPIGRHRYVHKLYALSTMLDLHGHPTKSVVERAMQRFAACAAAARRCVLPFIRNAGAGHATCWNGGA